MIMNEGSQVQAFWTVAVVVAKERKYFSMFALKGKKIWKVNRIL